MFKFVACLLFLPTIFCQSTDDFVISPNRPGSPNTANGDLTPPKIVEMRILSNVTNRFATTYVTSRVRNNGNVAKETSFFIIIPNKAYISAFIMEIGGKQYKAYVQEKEKAQATYDSAVTRGTSAAHVTARESNKFAVTVNIEPRSECIFYLKYEELLERKNGAYQIVLNVRPEQIVPTIFVHVNINEFRPITDIRTPPIQSGNVVTEEENSVLDPNAKITEYGNFSATVTFTPDTARQAEIAKALGTKNGMSCQFIVEYEVENDATGGEVLINNGHFIHFFAPSDAPPLKKYVIFILDSSGSMWGRKMDQLKLAMKRILDDLNPSDHFSVVEFNSWVKVWNLFAPDQSTVVPNGQNNNFAYYQTDDYDLSEESFPPAYPVTNSTIEKGLSYVSKLNADGSTYMYDALYVALHLDKLKNQRTKIDAQTMIIFLTDGQANGRKSDPAVIVKEITEKNVYKTPIISLSFGDGADRPLLEKLSAKNSGFNRHIYEDSDSALQLENFYSEISSPLFTNLTFKYSPGVTSLTKVYFPIYYYGSEIVVAGKIAADNFAEPSRVSCTGTSGLVFLMPVIIRPIEQLERMWAYLTVQMYLNNKEVDDLERAVLRSKALKLSLDYNFVTDVTSMVVVKPESSNVVGTEAADKPQSFDTGSYGSGSGASNFGSGMGVAVSGMALNSFGGGAGVAGPLYTGKHSLVAARPMGVPPSNVGTGMATSSFDTTYYDTTYVGTTDHQIYDASTTVTTAAPFILPQNFPPALNWLQRYLSSDGSITFLSGNAKLGYNANVIPSQDCIRPNSEVGLCTLLRDCPQLHNQIPDPRTFKEFYCPIPPYAGVCCSKRIN